MYTKGRRIQTARRPVISPRKADRVRLRNSHIPSYNVYGISNRILKRSEEEFKKMKSRGTLIKIVHARADKEKIGSLREEMRVVLDSINVSAIRIQPMLLC
jgi:hypothetical protein